MELFNSKPFKIAIWILLISLIIYVGRQVAFIFMPVLAIARILFIPTLLSVILYYLFHPIVAWLEKYNISRAWSVILIYLGAALLGVLLLLTIGTTAYRQFIELIDLLPEYIEQITASVAGLEDAYFFRRMQENGMIDLTNLAETLSQAILGALPGFRDSMSAAFSFLANTLLIFALVPIILFYMLKDGDQFYAYIRDRLPGIYKDELADILGEIDRGLASFIKGQVIVAISVGTMSYIGFLIIGIRHPLILALLAGLMNFIPYIGPTIGSVPALLVGMVSSTAMTFKVILLIAVIQQIENFFIMPQVMGRKLYVHPLTIIVLLVVVGSLAGLLGLIFAVPTFIILKIVSTHLYEFIKQKRQQDAKSSG
ncbi:MAG: AI-2E family transporter [Bacillota bacterium]|nr:AI-2E family transporter [Bacillota bacterium]MDW7684844.1 AI-2E family transporter [Bacillota bacterium]